jgi:hypothetical protein
LTERTALRALALALALVVALPAPAQVLYKLIDRQGRVTYSDAVPKSFDGTVVRIEPDSSSNVLPSGRPPEAEKTPAAAAGMAEDRRRNREELEKKLRAAQARFEAAKKAVELGQEPQPGEMQTVQRRQPPLKRGESPPRPNCYQVVDPNGVASLVCPQQVPQDSYYERRRKLDQELRLAEEELAQAERAYRRGTD